MSNSKNSKAKKFIESKRIEQEGLSEELCVNSTYFNFKYLTKQKRYGKLFEDLTHVQLLSVVSKIIEFSKKPLHLWSLDGNRFVNYVNWPRGSNYRYPDIVPPNVQWCRFRIEGDFRLIGFLAPKHLYPSNCDAFSRCYIGNVFYVVFLDDEHDFWD